MLTPDTLKAITSRKGSTDIESYQAELLLVLCNNMNGQAVRSEPFGVCCNTLTTVFKSIDTVPTDTVPIWPGQLNYCHQLKDVWLCVGDTAVHAHMRPVLSKALPSDYGIALPCQVP